MQARTTISNLHFLSPTHTNSPAAGRAGVVSLVMLREPVARQLSAFYHGTPHSQRTCSMDGPERTKQPTLKACNGGGAMEPGQSMLLGRDGLRNRAVAGERGVVRRGRAWGKKGMGCGGSNVPP